MTSIELSIKDILESGIHIGHSRRSRNPELKPFILKQKNGTQIIDVRATANGLEKIFDVVSDIAKNKGRILFVLTDKANQRGKAEVEKLARDLDQHWMTVRWPGGVLTNIATTRNSLRLLGEKESLLKDESKTKKQKLSIEREVKKVKKIFEGLVGIKKIPDLLFIFNTVTDKIPIAEACCIGIPVAAVVDTNGSMKGIDYVIPGNDDSLKSIKMIADLIRNAFESQKSAIMTEKDRIEEIDKVIDKNLKKSKTDHDKKDHHKVSHGHEGKTEHKSEKKVEHKKEAK